MKHAGSIRCGIMTRTPLKHASFSGTIQLGQSIHDFIEAYNGNVALFVWRKRDVRGAPLRKTTFSSRNQPGLFMNAYDARAGRRSRSAFSAEATHRSTQPSEENSLFGQEASESGRDS